MTGSDGAIRRAIKQKIVPLALRARGPRGPCYFIRKMCLRLRLRLRLCVTLVISP